MSLPNGDIITSVATGELHLSDAIEPITAHVFPDNVLNRTLLSVADICASGCTTTFTNTDMIVTHNGTTVLHNTKAPMDKLWPISLPPGLPVGHRAADNNTSGIHNVVRHQHIADFVAYAHASLCSPSLESLAKALRAGFLGNFPRLTSKMLADNQPASMATAKGHLNRNRQSQRHRARAPSTAQTVWTAMPDTNVDDTPLDTGSVVQSIVMSLPQRNNSDATGKVPVCSSTGNNYILVSVFNSYIHLEAMASREGAQYVAAMKRTIEFFRSLKHEVTYQRMDNETSRLLERFMQQEGIEIEYVPPHNHRANPAERAIQTAKNHLVSALCGTHPNFPANLWDKLLPQVELTMNIIRPFATDRAISAYEGVHGKKFDFVAHPLAPCGTLVLAHDPPEIRASFASHGSPGFYLGPAMQHYRSFRVFILATKAERVSDSLAWFPAPLMLPGSRPSEIVCDALRELLTALRARVRPAGEGVAGADDHHFEALADKIDQIIRQAESVLAGGETTVEPVPVAVDVAAVPTTASQQRVTFHAPPPPNTEEVPPLAPTIITRTFAHVADEDTAEQRVVEMPPPSAEEPNSAVPPPSAKTKTTAAPKSTPAETTVPRSAGRPQRGAARPHRYRQANHVTTSVNDMAYRELEEVINEFVKSDEVDDPFARFNDFCAVDLKAICGPIAYKDTKRGPDRVEWRLAESEEIIRLVDESRTMRFIQKRDKPEGRLDSYANPQPSIKVKNGVAVRRMRMVYGGNRSDYSGPLAAQTADLTTIKCLFNAAISEEAAKLATADIKDFYLGTELERFEYMRITREQLPQDIINRYGLEAFMNKSASKKRQQDWVMVEITKGIYGLPQAGRLAQEKLVKHLAQHGYTASDDTPCLFSHTEHPTKFTLVVDDFAIKYNSEAGLDHLLDTLREGYTITVDREIKKYVGINVDFNRAAKTVSLSMPDYVKKALKRFEVVTGARTVDSPLLYTPPSYGKSKQQYAPVDVSRKLNNSEINRLQQIIGVFLYYARAVDSTMLTALSKFGSLQSRGTQDLSDAVDRFLQYAAHWPVATLVYHASDMRLMVESDASYLSEPEARSRAGGLHYLGNYCVDTQTNRVNGAIECMSTIIKSVVSSAFEAEYAALFMNGQTAQGLRNTLRDLGFPQPATPFISDNACAVGVANRTVKQRRSKAIDMRFHWLRDRVKSGDFTVKWQPGKDNLADYFTKAHPVHHYKAMRSTYVQ